MNAGGKHWQASLATMIGAVAVGVGSASAVELTSEQMLGNTAAILGSSPSRDSFGVNIFGDSGNGALQGAMISTLFQQGVRKFRVNNIGGWPLDAYAAINKEAGMLDASERAKVSVYVPSQYFGMGQAPWQNFDVATTKGNFTQWSNVPHWIIQLDACNPVDTSSPVYCPNPTETGLGALATTAQLNDYIDQIKNAVPAFQGQPYTVEFVIPYQDSTQSPDARLAQVKQATVDAFPQVRFTLERLNIPSGVGTARRARIFPLPKPTPSLRSPRARALPAATLPSRVGLATARPASPTRRQPCSISAPI